MRRFATEEEDQRLVTQNTNRDLIFDQRTGRFFEKNLEEVCREEFCLVDEDTGEPILLTREEKERIFLDTLQSYYYDGTTREGPQLTDEQFDMLKEDLSWEGSSIAMLNRKEMLFMNAMTAYLKGKPIISDSEFDELKKSLQADGSVIAVQTDPQCYLDSGVCKVTWLPDRQKNLALFVPGLSVAFVLWLGVVWELVPPLRQVNPLFYLVAGSPFLYVVSSQIKNLLFQDPLIAKGPCPNCGVENTIYFGDVLGVEGFADVAELKCQNCKEDLQVIRSTLRVSTNAKSGSKGPAAKKEAQAA